MELTQLQFLTGLFSLILAIISIYVGLYIASRYRKFNNKILLYVGISWVGMTNGWWPSSISFLLVITTGNPLSEVQYFLIGNIVIAWWLFIWMIGVTELLYKERQKLILIIFAIYAIVYQLVLFYYILTDPSKIGTLQGPVDVQYRGLLAVLLITILVIVLITGLLFARESLKSDNPESKLRGKFIALAFISWAIGGVADAVIPLNLITLPLIRILLISSSIEFYIGIILPNPVKRIFLKE